MLDRSREFIFSQFDRQHLTSVVQHLVLNFLVASDFGWHQSDFIYWSYNKNARENSRTFSNNNNFFLFQLK